MLTVKDNDKSANQALTSTLDPFSPVDEKSDRVNTASAEAGWVIRPLLDFLKYECSEVNDGT